MKLTSSKDSKLNLISALVFGDSGIGKTTSIRTLPEQGTLVASVERRMLPLRKYNYQVLPLKSWEDVRTLARYFITPDDIEDAKLKTAIKGCRVLVVDSLSEISMLCQKHIILVDRRRLVRERTKDRRESPEGIYEEQMAVEDWGLYKTRILNLIDTFNNLPIHNIFTCLAAWSEDKQGRSVLRTPNLNGKAARECARYFDLVLHMEARETDNDDPARTWRTFNDGRIIAKDSSGMLDPFEPTDWTALFAKILTPKEKT